jgi:nucleoside-diphosphate-sugar epimerase
MSNSKCIGETFNIGTGTNHNILDIVKMIDGPHKHIPPRPAESRVTLSDSSKARLVLGWSAKIKLEDWMSKNVK